MQQSQDAQPEKESSQDDQTSVRERIEDKRKAVLGAMSPSPAVDFSSQRSAQRAFPHSSPFSDQPQGRPLQRGSPSFSPYSELGSLRMTPVASSPGQGMYDELAEGAAGNADRDNQQQQPQQPQQEQTSLADRLRTSLTSGHGGGHRPSSGMQQASPGPHTPYQETAPLISTAFQQRDSAASSQGSQRGVDMRAAQHSAPSAADAKLLSALRVCSDAGALGTVLHVREGPPPATIGNNSPAMASYGSEQSRGLPQQQEPLQLQGRPYSWEAGQGQGQAKRPRLAAREDDGGRAESARAGGYDGSEAWARSAAPASIGSIEEPLRGQPIGYMSDLVSAGDASGFGATGHVVRPAWERPVQRQPPQPWQHPSPQLPSGASSQRSMSHMYQGQDDAAPSHPRVDIPVAAPRQEPRLAPGMSLGDTAQAQMPPSYSGGTFEPQQSPAPLQTAAPASPHLKRRRTMEIQESEEDVYVLFNLPPADGHRAEPPAAWDSPAAALLSLSSSAHYGPVRCQWLFSKQLTASDTNKLGRIILPRQAVEHFLPWVEDRAGLDLNAWDTSAAHWSFKLKFWMNGSNPKRMYVVENTRDFVRSHALKPGSILSFYCAPDGRLVVDPHPVDDYFEMAM